MKKLFVSVSLMLLTLQFSWGCTAFCLCFLNRAILAKNLDWPVDAGEPVKHSFDILDTVIQPDTRWSIVYDATRLRIHVKFHACPNKQEISLPELLQSVGKFSLGAKVSDCNLGNIGSFRPFSKKHNSDLVFGVMDLLGKELDLSSREALFKDLIHYSNTYVFE